MNNGVAAAGGGYNTNMVRAKLPGKTQTMIYVAGTAASVINNTYWDPDYTWGSNAYSSGSYSSRGMCDNADCHNVVKVEIPAGKFPMSTFVAGTAHTGGVVSTGTPNCSTCHTHTDGDRHLGMGRDGRRARTATRFRLARGAHVKHTTALSSGGAGLSCRPVTRTRAR